MTTSARTVSVVQQKLRAAGLTASEIGLNGRFHWLGHATEVEALVKFCASNSMFQFPDASALVLPTRSSQGGEHITCGQLSSEAIRTILLEPQRWYETFRKTQESKLKDKSSTIVSFGPERCVPPSILRSLNQQVVHLADYDRKTGISALKDHHAPENDIAVVGMSCKVAGADDLEGYWKLLCEGKSQHKEVPNERFGFETVHRELDLQRKWYGNFINDYDKFDHKFFKKSPRESANMDPQQRQILQIAYQAVHQSGYFRKANPDKHVGCYVGVCSTDYEDNMACHAPTAYTATGHLRGFIAGKVSHFFGWTGPGLTIDTACSSSAVAVHQACRAILSGECNAAVAGGSHVMSSPLWYQNLAGASFLSKTGSCKPFDAAADGYCRGEGVAAVFLKKLSDAVADGDQIIGVIAGTAVQQNENCTPIVVPNVPSLSSLFENVLKKARLRPDQVTVVEAHGTGTPVGDPAEFDSVRKALGGPKRSSPLALGSVKGLVGHCECTSGMVSLIKVLLMIREGAIPPQASFKTLNPVIKMSPADQMQIPTSLIPWNADFKAALINNYGASGSNASMIITQAPGARIPRESSPSNQQVKLPFWFCGLDDRSLRAYIAIFRMYLRGKPIFLPDLSFHLSRQANRTLERSLVLNCSSIDDLEEQLSAYERNESVPSSIDRPTWRPLVLCFGGQISNHIGLNHQLYDSATIFRKHLDQCNSQSIALGIGSIFPDIFQRAPIEDPVKLQVCLFSSQYSCARSWMDCGAQPVAVVGHSFGELTSLCIAEVLSLEDTLKVIVARARIIRDSWGPERGAMMAIEAKLDVLQTILDKANRTCSGHEPAVVACYNSATSYTVAGSATVIDAVGEIMRTNSSFSSLNSKKLNVTHAFHSTLVDPLTTSLIAATKDMKLQEPKISMGRCTEDACDKVIPPEYFADHLRNPVFFNHSVQRLAQQYPQCIWLEAGSNSTITNMASRALSSPRDSHFQSINITNDHAQDNLADATLSLWKAGLDVSFWAHHTAQASSYAPLLLPPYQFEPARHWLELKKPPQTDVSSKPKLQLETEKLPDTLTTFVGYQDKDKRCARFRVNTMIPKYENLMAGHTVAFTAPILPATVQMDLAIESLRALLSPDSQLQPQVRGIQNDAPICTNRSLSVWLDLETSAHEKSDWRFRFSSTNPQQPSVNISHTKGEILLRSADDMQTNLDFAGYERITGHSRCKELMANSDASSILQGRSIYRLFSEVVDYGEQYQGVQKVVGDGQTSAARIVKKYDTQTWFDAHLSDTYCQVAGIWVNYMTDRSPTNLYICKGMDRWLRSPKLDHQIARPEAYDVLAYHQGSLEDGFMTDLFVFHPTAGQLLEVVLGVRFVKVAKASLVKLLLRLTPDETSRVAPPSRSMEPIVPEIIETKPLEIPPVQVFQPVEALKVKARKQPDANAEILSKLKIIMVELSGVEPEQIKEHTELADIGIDSLMGMELVSEIERAFKCALQEDEIAQVTDVIGVIRCIQSVLNPNGVSEFEDSEEDNANSVFDGPRSTTSETRSESSVSVTDFSSKEASKGTSTAIPSHDLIIPTSNIFEAWKQTKALTDEFIVAGGCSDYVDTVLPQQNNLCIALTLAAFDQLGANIKSAKAGEEIILFKPLPAHVQLVRNLCEMLERIGGLIRVDGATITRTDAPYPTMSGEEMMRDPSKTSPKHHDISKLIFYVGSSLADALSGKVDGVKLVFGRPEGRDLVSKLYGDWVMNRPCYKQMEDFLARLVSTLSPADGPIKILEMGGGTGGTTKWLVPLLASLNHPVEYTFTDLGPSFVAGARKNFKQYAFMDFRAHDIEKEPVQELQNRYHMVVSSNAVHATHSLVRSTTNIKKALLPNGILMMLEMIEPLYWIDMIFGLFEGWWLFDDGRAHALTPVTRWKTDLQSVGFGHVDWTDGTRLETNVNKVIMAVACEQDLESETRISGTSLTTPIDNRDRQAAIDEYVRKKTLDFVGPNSSTEIFDTSGDCVLVTGATGSTGSHLVASLASRTTVKTVVCLNRRSNQDPKQRQLDALSSKGIVLSADELAKLEMLETDTTKPTLGLPEEIYQGLAKRITHIIHNAWVMSIKRPIKGFETQFNAMRNLIDLARDASNHRPAATKVTFQFISSIAVVGQYPLWAHDTTVPESRMPIDALLPIGYADAKYVCELMLDKTLHLHPSRFRTSVVRLGQIAGSKKSGYWNTTEQLSFLWKSSQALSRLPALEGPLSWTPVDDVAGTLVDLLYTEEVPYPVYNIDNPVRQQWGDMMPVIADALDIPRENIVPFGEWVNLIRGATGLGEKENPAVKLVEFLDAEFLRMACALKLDTTKAREHSATLRAVGPVSEAVARSFFEYWREIGFLS